MNFENDPGEWSQEDVDLLRDRLYDVAPADDEHPVGVIEVEDPIEPWMPWTVCKRKNTGLLLFVNAVRSDGWVAQLTGRRNGDNWDIEMALLTSDGVEVQ